MATKIFRFCDICYAEIKGKEEWVIGDMNADVINRKDFFDCCNDCFEYLKLNRGKKQ